MQLVVDTSVLVAVVVNEPARPALIEATRGVNLVAPASVHWEVGNALAALMKRRLASLDQALDAALAYGRVPLRLVDVDLAAALELAAAHHLYAYDAYVIACAKAQRCALLTLDERQARAAAAAGVELTEVL